MTDPDNVLARRAKAKTDIIVVPPTGETCAICLSAIVNDCVRTPCGHDFHMGCLDEYLLVRKKEQQCDRRTPNACCPLCRGSMRLPVGVEVSARSGLRIEVTDVPETGGQCHFDRGYVFLSLGDFQQPGMRYIMTSNDDRKTPASESMWILETSVETTVHLNFRSEEHVSDTGASAWLASRGWHRNSTLKSTKSTGYPRGSYQGPVFSQKHAPGTIELMGSNTWEGVYFVFVEVRELLAQALAPAEALPSTEASPQDVGPGGSVQWPGDHVRDNQRSPPRIVRRSADVNPPSRNGWRIQQHAPQLVHRGGGTVQRPGNNIQDGHQAQQQHPQVAHRAGGSVQRPGDGVQERPRSQEQRPQVVWRSFFFSFWRFHGQSPQAVRRRGGSVPRDGHPLVNGQIVRRGGNSFQHSGEHLQDGPQIQEQPFQIVEQLRPVAESVQQTVDPVHDSQRVQGQGPRVIRRSVAWTNPSISGRPSIQEQALEAVRPGGGMHRNDAHA